MRPQSLAIRLLPPFAGWFAIGATLLPAASPLRAAPVAVFLLAGPGAAVLRICAPAIRRHQAVGPAESWDSGFARDSDRLEQLVLMVFLSVSATLIGATVLMAAHAFSGQRVLVLLTLLTMLAACCPRLRSRTRTARASSPPQKGSPL
ncbi:hypothetical protein HRW07_09435 [Streptomyces lunaelactis]|uniref:hypothetical protein n=1 Tax=Streptomyces lunaelactis TaxID=1535768 RepID=UPI0015848130|nr:hypothetical protein [Streptomyces lunaelactis]NUL03451.1 hypothetical protein [Streptomyces lunaelactis]